MQQEQDSGLSLAELPERERTRALARFQAIRPFIEDDVPLSQLVAEPSISLRTARYWIKRYRQEGLVGLARKERNDKDGRKLAPALQGLMEGRALQKPPLSAAAIHRKAVETATRLKERPPSYDVVYSLI